MGRAEAPVALVAIVVALGAVCGGCFDPALPEPLPPIACFDDDD